jgi:hypothetical protein
MFHSSKLRVHGTHLSHKIETDIPEVKLLPARRV